MQHSVGYLKGLFYCCCELSIFGLVHMYTGTFERKSFQNKPLFPDEGFSNVSEIVSVLNNTFGKQTLVSVSLLPKTSVLPTLTSTLNMEYLNIFTLKVCSQQP